MAEFESERIGEEWRAVHANRRRRGLAQVPQGRCFGYVVPAGRAVLGPPDPEEARAVRELFEMRSRGASLSELSRWLRREGFRPVRGGDKFTPQTIRDMLRNPIYAGKVRLGDELISGQHEALVSDDLFEQVQALWRRTVDSNRGRPGGLCRGLARCAECGSAMNAWYGPKGEPYYRCQAHQRSRDCRSKPTIRRAVLDAYVESELLKLIDPKRVKPAQPGRQRAARLRRDRARLEQVKRSARTLIEDRLRNPGTAAAFFDDQIQRLGDERTDLEQRIREDEADMTMNTQPVPFTKAQWPKIRFEGRKAVIEAAISRVLIGPGKRGGPQPPMAERVTIEWN